VQKLGQCETSECVSDFFLANNSQARLAFSADVWRFPYIRFLSIHTFIGE